MLVGSACDGRATVSSSGIRKGYGYAYIRLQYSAHDQPQTENPSAAGCGGGGMWRATTTHGSACAADHFRMKIGGCLNI